MPQILVEGLAKTYRVAEREPGAWGAVAGLFHRRWRTIEALKGVNFSMERGELIGLIGPNGAGKSTTIKILSGIMRPSAGRCEVDGLVPWLQRVQHVARIGVVFGQRTQLWWDLPVIEGFDLLAAIYKVPPAQYRATRDQMVGLMRLEKLLDQPVRQLSLGQRMRCEIAAAMLHDPSILFLDEPTIGLDVSMQATVRDFVRRYSEQHRATLILTSHYMEDVEQLCPRVIVIDRGKLVYDGALEDLVARTRPDRRIVLRFTRAVDAADLASLGKLVRHDAGQSVLQVPKDSVNGVVGRVLAHLPVSDLTVERAPLEEVMSELFARNRAAP